MNGSPFGNLKHVQYDFDFSVPFRHRVRFTTDLANREFDVLLDLIEPTESQTPKVLLVVDQGVAESHPAVGTIASRLASSERVTLLGDHGSGHSIPQFQITGGERCKNDDQEVNRVLEWIQRFDIDRRSYIVVIGGGAVLDAVGFAAAIAHRGVRLIRIPTTTLAQGDSGVGVKNAINYFGKKNWLGSFAVPWGVINDAAILESLDDRDFCCGFSEAVKVALLKSVEDFEFVRDHATQIRQRDPDFAFEAIRRSCLWHLRHIAQGGDPFEMLEARPLDFGHWSAHKLESMTEYRIRHGEAVGIGVALDCIYSSHQLGFPKTATRQVCQCLAELGLPLWDPALDNHQQLLDGLEEFRQHLGGRLTVTMLKGLGQPVDVHEINAAAMRDSILKLKAIGQQIRV